MKILFFAESLTCGGKERRILELIQYLKQRTNYEIALILTDPVIYYEYVYDLGIPITIFSRKGIKYDPLVFIKLVRYCRRFKPDIIHSWGKMTTFYSIPAKLLLRVPLVSNLIADASKSFGFLSFNQFFLKSDILFSDIILSNSLAGLQAYKINSHKARTIWNGVNLDRFKQNGDNNKIREGIGVKSTYVVIMVAAFSSFKDYDLFIDVAKNICKIRNDITFIAVGDGPDWKRIQERILVEHIDNVILTGSQNEVERLISISHIGMLCTFSEGISNSIIEYMALGKPVISTDPEGGSKEIIVQGETGYCTDRNADEIVRLINQLLDNENLRSSMGKKGKERIFSLFSVERMGKEFELVYKDALNKR